MMETALPEYYDPRDLSMCVAADTPLSTIQEAASADKLHYPIVYDETLGMRDHIHHFPFCSASMAFGPQADNILGLNIRLKGKLIKVGGRTVKNCTGFDLVRFLCASPEPIADIEHAVLRLRPRKDIQKWLRLDGPADNLTAFRHDLLHSPWSYETLALDALVEHGALSLQLAYSCMQEQEAVYQAYYQEAARKHDLLLTPQASGPRLRNAGIRYKTVLSDLIPRAIRWTAEHGGKVHAFCANGYGLYDPENDTLDFDKEHAELSALGGHLVANDFRPRTSPIFDQLSKKLLACFT
jgi:hypothetical protein